MFPGDATFTPYTGNTSSADTKSPTNGRIYMLKFSSSSQRHFFWLQSKSQHPSGDASWFSSRDKRYGEIINQVLAGEEVDVGPDHLISPCKILPWLVANKKHTQEYARSYQLLGSGS